MVRIFILVFQFCFNFGFKSKHQLDRQAISAIVVLDDRNLLTAASSIKWWHWPTKQLLKTFSGHTSEVQTLLPILFEDCAHAPKLPIHNKLNGLNGNGSIMKGDEKMHIDDDYEEEPQDENKLSSFYFLSAAKSDRYICAW